MPQPYTLYSAQGSGGVAVEAALTLMGQPYKLIESMTFDPDERASGDRVLAANPMRQVPALVLPSGPDGLGEVMTESAAILIRLAELHPDSQLAPGPDDPARAAFLRWMSFVSAAIYSFYWITDDPSRLAPDPAAQGPLVTRTLERIRHGWGVMEGQTEPGRYILGDRLSVLDLYVTVVSRFQPRRQRFYEVAPRLGQVVRRVDADPRLTAFWTERYPFESGWDVMPVA